MRKQAWSILMIPAWRRTDYMVIRPMAGGGWVKVAICKNRADANLIVEAVNKLKGYDAETA